MRAIILAAGVGSRLRPLTDTLPKCLVPVGGRPVLGWQTAALRAAGVDDITVVAGYRAPQVSAFCAGQDGDVRVVVNEVFDRTNNMFSLRLALGGHEREDTLICNGDVVFDAAIVAAMLAEPDRNLIAVEPGRYIAESMKVTVGENGRITGLSKAITEEDAFGVSIDLYQFTGHAVSAICRVADRLMNEEGNKNLWTEVAIDEALASVPVYPHDIRRGRWIEVDNFDDLAEGERLFAVPTP